MQSCGPVVRPHEILQTLIISIPQPSAAVKSFFELSRNFGAPEAMSALLLYRQQTADLPPIQRLAAGGEIYARSERGQWPPSAAGGVGAHRQGQKGTGHHMVSCPLLSPPPDGGTPHAMPWRITPGPGGPVSPAAAGRRNGGKASPSAEGKKGFPADKKDSHTFTGICESLWF